MKLGFGFSTKILQIKFRNDLKPKIYQQLHIPKTFDGALRNQNLGLLTPNHQHEKAIPIWETRK